VETSQCIEAIKSLLSTVFAYNHSACYNAGEVERLEISVEEIKVPAEFIQQLTSVLSPLTVDPDKITDYLKCMHSKCLRVSWNFTKYKQSQSNIIFYQIFYRKL